MMSAVRVRMSMRSHEQARSRSIPLVVAWMFSARATVPLDRPMLAAVELCVDAARCLCCAVRRAGGLAVGGGRDGGSLVRWVGRVLVGLCLVNTREGVGKRSLVVRMMLSRAGSSTRSSRGGRVGRGTEWGGFEYKNANSLDMRA